MSDPIETVEPRGPVFAGRERLVVLALCALAMGRVFIFSAAFPFFNNVDEQAHFDTVYKYARGYLPRENRPKFDEGAAEAIALYATPEYLNRPEQAAAGPAQRPAWSYPKAAIDAWLPGAVELRSARTNHEANSPPTYYLLAGGWYNLGKALGFENGGLLYWIRFLDIPIYGLLIWISYLLCRSVQPGDPTLRVGVPLILAFLPQDVFFSINSDVLSPLLFAALLHLSVRAVSVPRGLLFHVLAGALVAATFLTKYSNVAILLVFASFLWRAATAPPERPGRAGSGCASRSPRWPRPLPSSHGLPGTPGCSAIRRGRPANTSCSASP